MKTFALAVAAATMVSWLVALYLEMRSRRLEGARKKTKEFFNRAVALIEDADTPEKVARGLSFLAEHVNSRKALFGFAMAAAVPFDGDHRTDLSQMKGDARACLEQAIACFAMSMYLRRPYGFVLPIAFKIGRSLQRDKVEVAGRYLSHANVH